MSYEHGRVDLTPRKHHGFAVVLFILGTLLPPLAVAARFGFGKDFCINLVMTLCGYIPGHFHNFYIQNIRNNKNHRRTPKWAQKYGLVDTSKIERDARKRQWANRYNDRLPHSTLEGQEYAEGEVPDPPSRQDSVLDPDARTRRENGGRYWTENDERYYGQRESTRRSNASLGSGSGSTGGGSGGRWHYPANFEDALPSLESGNGAKKKKKVKKDRWARTEDAYNAPPSGKKRKSKRTKNHSTVGGADGDALESDRRSGTTSLDDATFPEDPEGGLHRERRDNGTVPEVPQVDSGGRPRDELEHEF